jgi:hypothetical protein
MKTILPVLLICIMSLSGCAVTSTSTVKVDQPEKYYIGLLSLIVDSQADISELDSVTYEEQIRGKFNNLENHRYRKQLEKTLLRNFERPNAQTRLVKSSDIFDINTDITYSQFLAKLRETGVDGILFVKQSNYWYSTNYTTVLHNNVATTTSSDQPNAAFHAYLIDTHTLKPVWYADSKVYGVSAGYDTLNNHLARILFNKLRKDKYILARR